MTEQEVIEWLDAKQIPVYNGSIMESMGRSIGCRVVRLSELAVALSSPNSETREEDDLAADEARVWQALNVGKGMAEALKLSGDSYSAGDWEDTKAGYGRLLESFRSQLDRKGEALAQIGRMTTRGDIKEIARSALREPAEEPRP